MKIKLYQNKDLLNRKQINLMQREIHIWCIRWKDILPFWEKNQSIMSLEEIEKSGRYHFFDDRMRYSAGKIITRLLLMQYLQEEKINFFTSRLGKPYHKEIAGKLNVDFNISHSGQIVIAAFSKNMEIGVDVQEIIKCPEYLEIAKNFFTIEEAANIEKEYDIKIFYQYWSAKEAYLKALGLGLNKGMDFFSVIDDVIKEHGKVKYDWKLIPITIKNYAAYVALHEREEK